MADVVSTKVVTGVVRLSYAHVWEPRQEKAEQKPKYSCSVIIPKSDKKTVAAIEAAVNAAAELGKATKFAGKIPANLKKPLRDGDVERPEDPAYEDSWFFNCSSYNAPGIVDSKLNKVMDKDEVYSGCFVRVSVNFYPYNNEGSKGVAAGLNNIMKVKDGDRLAGGSTAEEDFAELVQEDDDL